MRVFKVELHFGPMCHERVPAACKAANHPHDTGALQGAWGPLARWKRCKCSSARVRMLASSRSAGPDEIGVPEQMRWEHWSGVPPIGCSKGSGQHCDHRRQRPGKEVGSLPPVRPETTGRERRF